MKQGMSICKEIFLGGLEHGSRFFRGFGAGLAAFFLGLTSVVVIKK
jgi:hypothetical protein